MKYAFVNDELQEAQSGLSGRCPSCGNPMIAKCGDIKVEHWSHRGRRNCDPWWENETEWHRAWKGQFPKEWQEIVQHAENGEKHIADVKTDQGYVIEFQRSHIKPEERQAREDFYKKMVWVVDGTRRSTDKDKFFDALKHAARVDGKEEMRTVGRYYGALLQDWGSSIAPVFFDFGEDVLWGLLPKKPEESAYFFRVERRALIASLRLTSHLSFEAQLNDWDALIANHENYLRWQARQKLGPFLGSFRPRETGYSNRRRS